MMSVVIAIVLGIIAKMGHFGAIKQYEEKHARLPRTSDALSLMKVGKMWKFVFNMCLAYVIGITMIKLGIEL